MQAYRIVSLQRTEEIPHPSSSGKWYRYIISNDINHITGYRSGKLAEVREYLHDNIKRLNQKYNLRAGKGGYNKPFSKPCHLNDRLLRS